MQKLSYLAIALCISAMMHAQDTTNFNFGFNHLAISVKDVDVSAAFYIKTLHLREITNRSKLEA
jgi:hypothetical protein